MTREIRINGLAESTELLPIRTDLNREAKVKARVEAEAEAVVTAVDLANATIHVSEE